MNADVSSTPTQPKQVNGTTIHADDTSGETGSTHNSIDRLRSIRNTDCDNEDMSVSQQEAIINNENVAGGSSNVSSTRDLSGCLEKISDLRFYHSSEDIAKYLDMYNDRSLSPESSGDDATTVRDLQTTTVSGMSQSRVHSPDSKISLVDTFNRRRNRIKDFYNGIPNVVRNVSRKTVLSNDSDSSHDDSSDVIPFPSQQVTDFTPFLSHSEVRDQVIAKRLRSLDPTHYKLDKVVAAKTKTIQGAPAIHSLINSTRHPAASDASHRTFDVYTRNTDVHNEEVNYRNQSSARTSTNTDSSGAASRFAPSVLSMESAHSIDIGYWKVKPTESNMNITIVKAYNANT